MPFSRVIIYPYNLRSNSAKVLSAALNTKRVRPNGTYVPRMRDMVLNWGNSRMPHWMARCQLMLNKPQYIENASSKDKTFETLTGLSGPSIIVPWTRSKHIAKTWLEAEPRFPGKLKAVVCRTLTRACEGRGIVLAKTPDELVDAPLYTLYQPKSKEYRVHVFNGEIIDIQEKRKKSGVTDVNSYIRNHPNGWVFCRENVQCPQTVKDASVAAVMGLHLDFGAVDIGYHPDFGVAIYEVNTAPGIEGQTVTNYAEAIRKFQSVA